MNADAFGPNLKIFRELARLTQAQLAAQAGLSLTGIAQIEQGRREPGWSTVLKLALALDVTPNDFREPPAADLQPRGRGRPPKAVAAAPAKRKKTK